MARREAEHAAAPRHRHRADELAAGALARRAAGQERGVVVVEGERRGVPGIVFTIRPCVAGAQIALRVVRGTRRRRFVLHLPLPRPLEAMR